jgi:hypothetical protein
MRVELEKRMEGESLLPKDGKTLWSCAAAFGQPGMSQRAMAAGEREKRMTAVQRMLTGTLPLLSSLSQTRPVRESTWSSGFF